MKRDSIRRYVNNIVLDRIDSLGYDKMRQELAEKMRKRRETVYKMVTDQNFIIDNESVETLTESRPKYFSYLVLECEKRLLDLYKIDRDFNFGFQPRKNFKLFLFREKLMTEKDTFNVTLEKKLKDINSRLENLDKRKNLISEVVDKYGRTEKEEKHDRNPDHFYSDTFTEPWHKNLSMDKRKKEWVF